MRLPTSRGRAFEISELRHTITDPAKGLQRQADALAARELQYREIIGEAKAKQERLRERTHRWRERERKEATALSQSRKRLDKMVSEEAKWKKRFGKSGKASDESARASAAAGVHASKFKIKVGQRRLHAAGDRIENASTGYAATRAAGDLEIERLKKGAAECAEQATALQREVDEIVQRIEWLSELHSFHGCPPLAMELPLRALPGADSLQVRPRSALVELVRTATCHARRAPHTH